MSFRASFVFVVTSGISILSEMTVIGLVETLADPQKADRLSHVSCSLQSTHPSLKLVEKPHSIVRQNQGPMGEEQVLLEDICAKGSVGRQVVLL